jgi:hypothetical protein
VIDDFCEKLEQITKRKVSLTASTFTNEGLTAEQMIILQEFREDFLKDYDDQFMPLSTDVLHLFLKINSIQKIGTKATLTDKIKGVIYHNNKHFIQAIDAEIGNSIMEEKSRPAISTNYEIDNNNAALTQIREILKSFDLEIYKAFKGILKGYEISSKQSFKTLISFSEVDEEKANLIAKIYYRYLTSVNYFLPDQKIELQKSKGNKFTSLLIDYLD